MAALTCVVVTPERQELEEKTSFVALPLFDGELGVAPLHSPTIGRLGYGEMRIGSGREAKRYYVDGGFVQIADDVVTVLTNRAVPVEKLDGKEAQKQLAAAMILPATNPAEAQIRDRLVAQSRAQLRLAASRD